jgi:hypothetical protein
VDVRLLTDTKGGRTYFTVLGTVIRRTSAQARAVNYRRTAFLGKSRSWRRISTSRRMRRSSAASLGLSGSCVPVPYFWRQRHRDCSLTWSSSAT